ncbi:MAG: Ig-like domain-containing protein, partial [Prolixibacteraceae bacterium]
ECPIIIYRTYKFMDDCDNISVDYEQKITINDTIPPVITCPEPVQFEAGLSELEELTGLAFSDTEQPVNPADTASLDISAFDNCKIEEITYRDVSAGTCSVTVIRTFKVYDTCGNVDSCSHEIILNTAYPVRVDITADRTGVRRGEQVTFTAMPENGGTNPVYAWFVNGEEIPGEASASFTYTPEDGDEVHAALTSDLECAEGSPALSNKIPLTVNEPGELMAVPAVTDVLCYNDSTGSVELSVSGGVGGYSYNWSNGETTPDIHAVPAGVYTVVVTDSEDRKDTVTVTVNEPEELQLSSEPTHVGLSQDPAGSIDLTVEGGTGSYQYEWTGPDGFTSSAEDIRQLEAGRYSVTVTDENGCEKIDEVVITKQDPDFSMECPPAIRLECLAEFPPEYSSLLEFVEAGGIINSNCAIDSGSFAMINETAPEMIEHGMQITRTYSVQDMCGSIAFCDQNLMVTDSIPPVAVCHDITVTVDESGRYVLSDVDYRIISEGSSDNCTDPDDLTIEIYPKEFNCTEIGNVQFVNIIVTDEFDNQSTCVAAITVTDSVPPNALCKDDTVYLDRYGQVEIDVSDIDNGSFDNCALDTLFISENNFNCAHTGSNIVELTVIDKEGLSDVCTANVHVLDTIPPEISCKNISVQLDQNAEYRLTIEELLASSRDECGIDSIYLDRYILTCEDIGTSLVEVTAVDVNGNKNSCFSEITVYGNIAPIAQNDTVYIPANTSVNIDVAQNDFDVKTAINTSSVATVLTPSNGRAEVSLPSGIVTYTPENNFVGIDVFTYSICDDGIPCEPMCATASVIIYVMDDNIAPVAVNDYFTVMCFTITGDIIENDYDPDEDEISVDTEPVSGPEAGSLTIHPDGTISYEPEEFYLGRDSFMYRIYDTGTPSLSDTATVYINYISDYDCDGMPDINDIDDDNDGILDVDEMDFVNGKYIDRDSDGDGIVDRLDIDSDNDGIPDNIEWQSETGYIYPTGTDSNNNGWDDAYDTGSGGTYYPATDTDGDGIPDYLDIDSDNDNVPDNIEGHDYNADGIADTERFFSDSDHDGLDDAYDTYSNWNLPSSPHNETGSNAPLQDFDGDGIRDWRDPNDDGDEWPTAMEDLNNDGIYSNDDSDMDGHPEYLDTGNDCELFIPEGFSPNGDDIHDFFQIYCIQKYPDAKLMIFDRAGNKIFEKIHYGNLEYWGSDQNAWWWGTANYRRTTGSGDLPAGNYIYVLNLGNGEVHKGTVMISY